MERYADFCSLSRGAEIFATRWTPLVLRNLLLGCRTFTEIHDGLPGMSRTLLTQRLRLLEHHGIVERRMRPDGRTADYVLTEAGQGLGPVVRALGAWGEQWLEMPREEYDAGTLLWSLAKNLRPDDLPTRRTVIRFEVSEPQQRYWLLAERPGVEVCKKPPGLDEDGVVRTTATWLVRWQTGSADLLVGLRDGAVSIDGPAGLTARLRAWSGRCTFGDVVPRLAA
jgi:DNA-binding HxlR family transcriptional regulator